MVPKMITSLQLVRILLITILILGLSYSFLQVTTCCSFHAPTGSMEPTILPGDYGLVNKWRIGARIFDIVDAIDGKKVKVRRLPGYGVIEHNDVIVFNYPLIGKDSVGIDMRKYYCKRVIAIPGDTIEIRNCQYHVRGNDISLGNIPSQESLAEWLNHIENPQEHICYKTWPYDSIMNWTIRNFGPLFIPTKGSTIVLTRENTLLYGRYIAWEQQCPMPVWRDCQAWIQDKPLNSYTFKEDYYFTAGDRVENSADSRYWGLLPEPMIVGVTNVIWDSKDPKTGKRRWNRMFKQIK